MTDREMLLLSYGAMKALSSKGAGYGGNLADVVELLEHHLYPPEVEYTTSDEIEMRKGPASES